MKGSAPADNSRLDAKVVVPLKYLSDFWRSLDLPLINCEIELHFWWSGNCIISEKPIAVAAGGDNPAEAALTTGATF